MPKISPDVFNGDPSDASAVAHVIGILDSLSAWWLGPVARKTIQASLPAFSSLTDYPAFDDRPGSAAVLFAKSLPEDLPLLADAFVLPVRWEETTSGHDRRLPPSVCQLANDVATQLGDLPSIKGRKWALLANLGCMPDLSALKFPAESGWGAIAAALITFSEKGRSHPAVACSCAWDPDSGVKEVSNPTAKIDAARKHGVTRFFLPENQAKTLGPVFEATTVDGISNIRSSKSGQFDIRATLSPLLQHFSLAPYSRIDTRQELDETIPWANAARRMKHHPVYATFYREHLLPAIVRFRLAKPDLPRIDCLVTWLSRNPEVTAMVAAASGAKSVLALWDGDEAIGALRSQFVEMYRHLTNGTANPPSIERVCVPKGFMDVNALLAGPEAKRLVASATGRLGFDVTPGKKTYTIGLCELARPNDVLLYLEHMHIDNGTEVGTEELCFKIVSAVTPRMPIPSGVQP